MFTPGDIEVADRRNKCGRAMVVRLDRGISRSLVQPGPYPVPTEGCPACRFSLVRPLQSPSERL